MNSPDPFPSLSLTDRCYVVTGAAGGIGAGLVEGLTAAGASVLAQVRSRPIEVLDDLADRVAVVAAELTDDDAPDRLVRAAVERFGRVDGLINNAADQSLDPFDSLTDEAWQSMIDINLTAAHRLTQAVANELVAAGRAGSVVHISSIEARHPTPVHGHYSVSKAALVAHARAGALTYGRHGIRVNTVLPGLIDRPGLAEDWPEGVERWNAAAPMGRLGTPADIAAACVFLCSDMASWITGTELVVDGGVLTNPTW